MSGNDSDKNFGDSLQRALNGVLKSGFLDARMRQLAEQVRLEAISELERNGDDCEEKRKLINSLTVVAGKKPGEYLVQASGEYGEKLEFGAKNSIESPWLIPAFVTVRGLIHTCQHGATNKTLLKARRLYKG